VENSTNTTTNLSKKWCDYCLTSPFVIGDICRWPCSRTSVRKARLHFFKSNRISDPDRPIHDGLRSVQLRFLNSKDDIDFSFVMEKRYQTALMKIKDFLLLEYDVRDGINNKVLRDRTWIGEMVEKPENYCLVPKSFINELQIIKAFKNRCRSKNINILR
jgi:hypothetical protein